MPFLKSFPVIINVWLSSTNSNDFFTHHSLSSASQIQSWQPLTPGAQLLNRKVHDSAPLDDSTPSDGPEHLGSKDKCVSRDTFTLLSSTISNLAKTTNHSISSSDQRTKVHALDQFDGSYVLPKAPHLLFSDWKEESKWHLVMEDTVLGRHRTCMKWISAVNMSLCLKAQWERVKWIFTNTPCNSWWYCHIHRFLQVQLWAFRRGLCIYFGLSPSVPATLN